ncbi:hypothetical protein J4467_01805 [Candidatus Woesearchaeota archaeon]|nr:hypothetical protein [Candidatus Woesearchaeota archaeon]
MTKEYSDIEVINDDIILRLLFECGYNPLVPQEVRVKKTTYLKEQNGILSDLDRLFEDGIIQKTCEDSTSAHWFALYGEYLKSKLNKGDQLSNHLTPIAFARCLEDLTTSGHLRLAHPFNDERLHPIKNKGDYWRRTCSCRVIQNTLNQDITALSKEALRYPLYFSRIR